MQQPPPPGGRPPGPGVPGRPPYPPPGGVRPPGGPPAYGQPAPPYGSYGGPPGGTPPAAPKRRGSLRFLAGTCIFSAWLTLIVSVIGAGTSFMSAASVAAMVGGLAPRGALSPSSPGAGMPGADGLPNIGSEDGGTPAPSLPGGGAGPLLGLLGSALPVLCIAGGVFSLVSGVVTFLLFLGLGQACYVLLDLEQQSLQMSQAIQIILARLGAGR